jgi:hypothetical protein
MVLVGLETPLVYLIFSHRESESHGRFNSFADDIASVLFTFILYNQAFNIIPDLEVTDIISDSKQFDAVHSFPP